VSKAATALRRWRLFAVLPITTNQAAIIAVFPVVKRYFGNLPPI